MSTDIILQIEIQASLTVCVSQIHTHTAVQAICFVYLERNGNTSTPLCLQVTKKLLLTCFCLILS